MNKRIRIFLAVGALALASAGALAYPGHGDRHPPPGGPDFGGHAIERLLGAVHDLNLSDAQRDDIRAAVEGSRDAIETNRQAVMDAMQQLHDLLDADSLDENALDSVADQMGQLAKERVLLTSHTVAGVLATLDASQRDELRAKADAWRDRMRDHLDRPSTD